LPRISEFYGIVVSMFYNDHEPPHFHVAYAEYGATIGIATGELLKGALPGRALNLVLEWVALHQDELQDNWQRARNHEELRRIPPLE
jgi:hypothetical protein